MVELFVVGIEPLVGRFLVAFERLAWFLGPLVGLGPVGVCYFGLALELVWLGLAFWQLLILLPNLLNLHPPNLRGLLHRREDQRLDRVRRIRRRGVRHYP